MTFPRGFLWGACTASHQVEGGNCWNDWWPLEQSGRLPYKSGDACRQYELYEQDLDMARAWGHNAHRLSIEWSRIEPREGEWSVNAVEHYVRVIEALRARGIEPVVTLHHFTNPQWFAERGGWARRDSVKLFGRYVEYVAQHLAPRVRFWVSVNEPTVYVKRAYVKGDWPPCKPGQRFEGAIVLFNMCRAHHVARRLLHAARPDAMVGISHSAPYIEPCNPHSVLDRWAAFWRDFVLNRAVTRLALGWSGRGADFIGLNYYNRQIAKWRLRSTAILVGEECVEDHHGAPRQFSALGWEIYPPGLARTLLRFGRYGLPLMITENGIATRDEAQRTAFVESHLRELAAAVSAGANVLGYLYWTLMDNFEWTEGTAPCFGLAEVDFATQERRPRPAAAVLRAHFAGPSMLPGGASPLADR